MKYFVCFILFSIVLNSAPLDDAKRALFLRFSELQSQASTNLEDIEKFYFLWETYLNQMLTPNDVQIAQIGQTINVLTKGSTGTNYVERYRRQRAQRNARSVMRTVSMAPVEEAVENPFEQNYGSDAAWDQIWADYEAAGRSKAKKAKDLTLAYRTFLNVLAADHPVRLALARGETLDPLEAANIILTELRVFFDRQLQTNADREETDADQLRIFAVRLQALTAFVSHHRLFTVQERIASIYRTLGASNRVQAKMTRARSNFRGPVRSQSRFVDSRQNSHFGSLVPTERAQSPHREDESTQQFDTEMRRIAQLTQVRRISEFTQVEVRVDVQDVSANGDCGFLALGTTRAAFVAEMNRNIENYLDIFDDFPVEQTDWLAGIRTSLHVGDVELALLARFLNRRIVVFHVVANEFVGHAAYGAGTELWIAHVGIQGQNPTHFMRLSPQTINPQTIIAELNASGETITKELRDRLLAAGFRVTGSKGKYVIIRVVTLESRKRPRDDNDTDPSSSVDVAMKMLLGRSKSN